MKMNNTIRHAQVYITRQRITYPEEHMRLGVSSGGLMVRYSNHIYQVIIEHSSIMNIFRNEIILTASHILRTVTQCLWQRLNMFSPQLTHKFFFYNDITAMPQHLLTFRSAEPLTSSICSITTFFSSAIVRWSLLQCHSVFTAASHAT